LKAADDGIETFVYDIGCRYPYKNLFLYNFDRKITRKLNNAGIAREYFKIFNSDYSGGCPVGHEGYGVPVF